MPRSSLFSSQLFFGELKSSSPSGDFTLWVYCIWQAHINGKTALVMSKNIASFTTSINENHAIDKHIRVSPNPFHNNLKIDINTNGRKADVMIFSSGGVQIARFSTVAPSNSWQTFHWHPTRDFAPGVYFIVLTTANKKYVKKVVLSD